MNSSLYLHAPWRPRRPSSACLVRLQCQPRPPLLPVRHEGREQLVEFCGVPVVPEVAELMGNHVLHTKHWCPDQVPVEGNRASTRATAPSAGHGAHSDTLRCADAVCAVPRTQFVEDTSKDNASAVQVPQVKKLADLFAVWGIGGRHLEKSTGKADIILVALTDPKPIVATKVFVGFQLF